MKQKKDIDQLDDAPNLNMYSSKPVENYGISLLKNMGFNQQKGIGKNKKKTQILILKSRPKGLGLGAENQNYQKKQMFEKGDSVRIKLDPHSGMFGYINDIHQDELSVLLYPSESIVKIKKKKVEILNQQMMRIMKQQFERNLDKQKKLKKIKWILPQIRIKVIDKESRYYLKKLIVTQILSQRQFECRDDIGNYINNLRQKQIQTVVPKLGGLVIVLKGQYKGQKGSVQERKKQKGKVWIKLIEQLQIIELQEDDICQYVQI